MIRLNELEPEFLEEIYVVDDNGEGQVILEEGNRKSGRFPRNLRIDQPTHGTNVGQVHAHLFGRRGDELGVVNLDGTASHGTRMRLHQKDADALVGLGFNIRKDRVVEWLVCDGHFQFICD